MQELRLPEEGRGAGKRREWETDRLDVAQIIGCHTWAEGLRRHMSVRRARACFSVVAWG